MTDTSPALPERPGQLEGPRGLRLLADWFDATRPNEPDEVQRDLRRWADDMETSALLIDVLDHTYKMVEKALPETFYAGRTPDERVTIMVDHWQRAMKVINAIEDEPPSPSAKRYKVTLCATCHHPGGRHLGGICNLNCNCIEWIEGGIGYWSDQMTEEASQ